MQLTAAPRAHVRPSGADGRDQKSACSARSNDELMGTWMFMCVCVCVVVCVWMCLRVCEFVLLCVCGVFVWVCGVFV